MVSTISTAKNAQCARIEAFCSFFLKLNELIESITSCMYLAGATYASKEIVCMRRAKGIATIKTNLFFFIVLFEGFFMSSTVFFVWFYIQRLFLSNFYRRQSKCTANLSSESIRKTGIAYGCNQCYKNQEIFRT